MPEWKEKIREQLAKLKLEPTREAEIVEELAQHLDDCYAEALAGGATPAEAYRTALAELSGSELLKRELRRAERQIKQEPIVLGTNRRTNMIADLWQDLRFGARMLLKQKGVTGIAALSLALGIGANTALFSVVDAMLLKTLPVKEPERLVLFQSVAPREFSPGRYNGRNSRDPVTGQRRMTSFPYQSYQRMREQPGALSDIFAFGSVNLSVNAEGQADVVTGQAVSGNYFAGLGVSAFLGRTVTDDDDQAAASPVAVLSHRYWSQRFGGNPGNRDRHILRHAAGLRRRDGCRLDAGCDDPDCLGAAVVCGPATLTTEWRRDMVVALNGAFATGRDERAGAGAIGTGVSAIRGRASHGATSSSTGKRGERDP